MEKAGRLVVFLVILSGVGAIVYWRELYTLVVTVLGRQDSSHGVFVPIIAAYFLWLKRDRLKGLRPETSLWPGALMLAAGILCYTLSRISGGVLSLAILSFLFICGALILFFFGRAIFGETVFPLFFLAAMIPLPSPLYLQIAEWMRRGITAWSAAVAFFFGVPLYREGYTISLPEINLYVAESCSGIRYLLSYFTFSLVYAYLFKEKPATRLLVVIGSIPLAFVAGITRLAVIFIAAYHISPVLAEHKPHVVLSWLVFGFWLLLGIIFDQFLSRDRDGIRAGKVLEHDHPS